MDRRAALLAAGLVLASGSPAAAEAADADEIVVVVAADSAVTEMSRLHLADLYLGRTSHFPGGGRAEPIDLEPGSPARQAFYRTYLGRTEAEIKAHWSRIIFTGRGRPPRAVATGAEVKSLVAGDEAAIGYLERRLVDDTVRVVDVE